MRAQQYHEYMLASRFDIQRRSLFQDVVCSLVRPGGTILDFGAGTGIDAKHYAKNGYKVCAYDLSSDMRGYLANYCRGEVNEGDVTIIDMDYAGFLAPSCSPTGRADAITANFAVLNLIDDHQALFNAFHQWLAPTGLVLASVLNPYYLGDARYGWWWRNRWKLLTTGRFSVGVGEGLSHRFGLPYARRAASPHFVLDGIFSATVTRRTPSPGRSVIPMSRMKSAVSLRSSLFMFLCFRRC